MTLIVMTNVVTFSRALADTTRWRIVRLVQEEAMCVCELADILEMPQSSVSSHVQIIRKAGLLESEKCEKWTYFRVRSEFLKVINLMAKSLGGADNDFPQDARKASARLDLRLDSCCPGPKKLASRRRLKPKKESIR